MKTKHCNWRFNLKKTWQICTFDKVNDKFPEEFTLVKIYETVKDRHDFLFFRKCRKHLTICITQMVPTSGKILHKLNYENEKLIKILSQAVVIHHISDLNPCNNIKGDWNQISRDCLPWSSMPGGRIIHLCEVMSLYTIKVNLLEID